jgi:hypothetical protein
MITFGGAFVKAFTTKIGKKRNVLTLVSPLTPELARKLKIHSAVFTQENAPKPELLEVKLNVAKTDGFDVRLEVPNIADVLHINACSEAKDWIARQKGSSKKGKPSRLMIEFKACFTGSAIGIIEWLEKYGEAAGSLTLKQDGAVQQEMPLSEAKPTKEPPLASKRAADMASSAAAASAAKGPVQ